MTATTQPELGDSKPSDAMRRSVRRFYRAYIRDGSPVAALEQATSGHRQLVILIGEPGIGKTRTAEELASYTQVDVRPYTEDTALNFVDFHNGEYAGQ